LAGYNEGAQTHSNNGSVLHIVWRFIASAIVLAVTAAVTRGFSIDSLWSLLLAALVLSVLDYVVTRVLHVDAKPFGRGIVGFIAAAVILYAVQYFVSGYNVTIWGAVIGALVYGIVDMLIPGRSM